MGLADLSSRERKKWGKRLKWKEDLCWMLATSKYMGSVGTIS